MRGDGGAYAAAPAYYMRRALGKPWLGLLFAVTITVTFGFVFNAVQSNTITAVAGGSLGGADSEWFAPGRGRGRRAPCWAWSSSAASTASPRSRSGWSPVMAIVYLVLGAAVVLLNVSDIRGSSRTSSAARSASARWRAARSARRSERHPARHVLEQRRAWAPRPTRGATAEVSHPVKRGLVQALGVFFDTLLICSMTAFIILTTNPALAGRQGADLTQSALQSALGGWAGHVLTAVVFMLCFSTLIGNYYYGESNIEYMTDKRWVLPAYRVLVLATVFLGALGTVSVVWNLADVFMGLMALINLAAIVPLSVIAFPPDGRLPEAAAGRSGPGVHQGTACRTW